MTIFDMDGLMIDSEPFWYAAQIKIFAKVDINLSIEDVKKTTGLRTFDIVKMRYKQKYNTKTISRYDCK